MTKEQSIVKIEQGVDKDTADKIRDADLPGVEIAEDTKRSYPLGAFASHTLGTVNDDNEGRSGLELQIQYISERYRGKMGQLYRYRRQQAVIWRGKILSG